MSPASPIMPVSAVQTGAPSAAETTWTRRSKLPNSQQSPSGSGSSAAVGRHHDRHELVLEEEADDGHDEDGQETPDHVGPQLFQVLAERHLGAFE